MTSPTQTTEVTSGRARRRKTTLLAIAGCVVTIATLGYVKTRPKTMNVKSNAPVEEDPRR